jgi:hypothetical protein
LCLLCTYLFVVQFSMTVRSASQPRSSPPLSRRLDYYITPP